MSRVIPVSNLDELESVILANGKVVVDFSAPAWCVPCQRLAPHFEAASDRMLDVVFVEVDVDTADPLLMDKYAVMGVPTVYAISEGKTTLVKSRTSMQLISEISAL